MESLGFKDGPFVKAIGAQFKARQVADGTNRTGVAFRMPHNDEVINTLRVGVAMETTGNMLKAINIEVEESKKILESLANEIHALSIIVGPALLNQAKELRSARMVVVNEVRDSLSSLRDVRKFFLESDYKIEIERLEKFVKVCKEIEELKKSGVFDAVCDSALRLAIQEKPDNDKG